MGSDPTLLIFKDFMIANTPVPTTAAPPPKLLDQVRATAIEARQHPHGNTVRALGQALYRVSWQVPSERDGCGNAHGVSAVAAAKMSLTAVTTASG